MVISENANEAIALRLLLMLVGALFVIMTGIGGFTAAHLVSQTDDLNTRITNLQAQVAASEVSRQDTSLRLTRIEGLLDEARQALRDRR